ncbi:hypothetical protein H4Q26_003282 [Puccinia striiformis f. sp. tritici PST-130]|nr:hypothetical protein H4Q26_003282 [Puccinia striiformis f. sp. tritici PST-130]
MSAHQRGSNCQDFIINSTSQGFTDLIDACATHHGTWSTVISNTTRKLESISELQVELDHSLYDLIPFAYLLMRPGLSSNWGLQTEDNHREDLKEFRIGVLFFKVVSLFRDICALFQSSSELILHLKISPTRASYERHKILMRLTKLVNQPQTKLDYNYDTESEEDGGVHDDSDDDSDDDS